MKPFEEFVPFMVGAATQNDSIQVFMPLFSNVGSGETGAYSSIGILNEEIRLALLDIYKERIAPIKFN
jgi:hypothetical protein